NGIRFNNQVTCYILNNKFNLIQGNGVIAGVAGTCISLTNHEATYLNIANNYFDNFDIGITAGLLTDIDLNITNNYFNTTAKFANSQATVGIRILRTPMLNLGNSPKYIQGNIIKHSHKGIFSRLAQGLTIQNNTIEFDPADIAANAVYRYGIHIIGGGNTGYGLHNIESNWIYKTGSVFNLADEKLAAINIQSSGKNFVLSNLINKMGIGVYFGTTTMSNTVHCNEMNDCLTGVRFDASDIGNQGTPGPNGISQGNKWNYSCANCYALKSVNSTTAPTWYVESSAPVNTLPSYPAPNNMFPLGIVAIDNNNILPATDCNIPGPTCPPLRMADIVSGNGDFANMSADERYRALNEVFRILNVDTFYMYMGLPSDIILQNFYDSAYFTNMGMLTIVDELIADSINFVAGILNSWISPINHFEENAAMVNDLYLTCCENGDCIFDSTQYVILYNIASENPCSGGDAVFKAREMLDLMFDDYLTEPAARFANSQSEQVLPDINVYPNPAKNYLAIEINNLSENFIWSYTWSNLLGKTEDKREGLTAPSFKINTSDIKQGVY
ncbi:MAG TPA: hypothetical protein PLO59_07215, partial [Bacteroidia bacterium]|nr:hypothetical protein [Bacteroidia bacterium]